MPYLPLPLPFSRFVTPRHALTLLIVFTTWLASGCAMLAPGLVGPPSKAIPASSETTLGRIAAESLPDPDLSGFALSARLELARRAERSLDVRYYQIEDDETGRYLLRQRRDAAARGVRVRLSMDDLYTSGEDELLLGLAAHPNIELRLFNPFPAGRSSVQLCFGASLFDFDRVNRRMHNKLFIADGAMAVAGGRNIGNQYFTRTAVENFFDLDTFVTGALVPRLATAPKCTTPRSA